MTSPIRNFADASFLSSDNSPLPDVSFRSYREPQTDSENENQENSMRSFIISDDDFSEDKSFLSLDSPLVQANRQRRKQPHRFAKADLNTPRRSFLNPILNVSDSLEKVNGLVYNNKDRKQLHGADDNTSEKSIYTPGSGTEEILDSVTNEAERALLLQLYPELTFSVKKPGRKLEEPSPHSSVHESSTSSSIQNFDNSNEKKKTSIDSNLDQSRNSSLSMESNDSFDAYLKKLRGPAKPERTAATSLDNDGFIVSDSESEANSLLDLEAEEDEEDEFIDDEEDFVSSDEENDDEPCVQIVQPIPRPKKLALAEALEAQFNSPSVPKRYKQIDNDDYFLRSISEEFEGDRHREAVRFIEKGLKTKKVREDLTSKLFDIFNRRCFDNELTSDLVTCSWNARLRTTAGHCIYNIKIKSAKIELSEKVCTHPERLRDTLAHEMCHAATWIIDGVAKARHGPVWKRWANKCTRRLPSLPLIERCHAYEIEKKFVYICQGENCGAMVKRHSKSLNTDRFVCARCKCKFVLTQNGQIVDGSTKPASKFALFVQQNYGKHKTKGRKHQEVMKILSSEWKKLSTEKTIEESEVETSTIEHDMSVLSIIND